MPQDDKALTEDVLHLIKSDELDQIQRNAHNYTKKHFAIYQIMEHLDKDLLSS